MENTNKTKTLDNLSKEQVDGKNVKGGNAPTVVNPTVLSTIPTSGPIASNGPTIDPLNDGNHHPLPGDGSNGNGAVDDGSDAGGGHVDPALPHTLNNAHPL